MDLIQIIQKKVDKYAEEYTCQCKPTFTVSLLRHDTIILTVVHGKFSFSTQIFPADKSEKNTWVYGLDDLKERMQFLFNRTM